MFIKNLCLIVNNDKAFLNEPITIFLGDKDIKLQIMLKQVKNQFNTKVLNDLDVLDSVESCEVTIQKPNGQLFTATAHVENKLIIIEVDSTWTDEVEEIGVHLIQIILLSADGGRITLPPVELVVAKPLEVREEGSEQIYSDLYTENGIALLSEDGNGLKISELPINFTAVGYVPFISMMNTGGYETQRFYFDMSQVAFKGYFDSTLEEEMIFRNTDTTLQPIGGIRAGESLNGLTIHQILNKLIFPSTAEATASITYKPSGRVFEKGSTVEVLSIYGTVQSGIEPLNSVKFYDGETVLETQYGVEGSVSYYFIEPVLITDSITSDRFRISANTDTKRNYANTLSLDFVYPYYYGVYHGDIDEITGEVVANMSKMVQTKGNKSIHYTTKDERFIFAYPSSYGRLMRISDINGFDVTGTFKMKEVMIECNDGTTQSYFVYANNENTVTNFKVIFYHEYY